MTTLQDRLRQARKAAGLTQGEVAAKAGLSQSTVAQIESGRNAGTRFAVQLAEALAVSVDWLLTGAGELAIDAAAHPKRRATDADEWLYFDLVAPQISGDGKKIEWPVIEANALRVHSSFFRGKRAQPSQCRVMAYEGDAMQPFLYSGDWYMVDLQDFEIKSRMMAFMRRDGEYWVNRVRKNPDGSVSLIDISADHPPFEFAPGEVEAKLSILGTVIFHTTPPTFQYQLK